MLKLNLWLIYSVAGRLSPGANCIWTIDIDDKIDFQRLKDGVDTEFGSEKLDGISALEPFVQLYLASTSIMALGRSLSAPSITCVKSGVSNLDTPTRMISP